MTNDIGMGIMIGVRDMFTANADKIGRSMQGLDSGFSAAEKSIARSTSNIMRGTAMMGAGAAMIAGPLTLVKGTQGVQAALAAMRSEGVDNIDQIKAMAMETSNQYGGITQESIVDTGYTMKAGLNKLSADALTLYMKYGAVIAKGTRGIGEDIAKNITTSYAIFKPMMDKLTDTEWLDAYAGAFTRTVTTFRATGVGFAEALKNFGTTGSALKMPMYEQFAMLGELMATMPGGEGGTAGAALISSLFKGTHELGIGITDGAGRLKPLLSILSEIKEKYPNMDLPAVQDLITKDFGSLEAMKGLRALTADLGGFKGRMASVASATKDGAAVMTAAADAMNHDIGSQFSMLGQRFANFRDIIGTFLIPVFSVINTGLAWVVMGLQKAASAFPVLTTTVASLVVVLGVVVFTCGAVWAGINALILVLTIGSVTWKKYKAEIGETTAAMWLYVGATERASKVAAANAMGGVIRLPDLTREGGQALNPRTWKRDLALFFAWITAIGARALGFVKSIPGLFVSAFGWAARIALQLSGWVASLTEATALVATISTVGVVVGLTGMLAAVYAYPRDFMNGWHMALDSTSKDIKRTVRETGWRGWAQSFAAGIGTFTAGLAYPFSMLHNLLKSIWAGIAPSVKNSINELIASVRKPLEWLSGKFKDLWNFGASPDGKMGIFSQGTVSAIEAVTYCVSGLSNAISWLYEKLKELWNLGASPDGKMGIFSQGTMAVLHGIGAGMSALRPTLPSAAIAQAIPADKLTSNGVKTPHVETWDGQSSFDYGQAKWEATDAELRRVQPKSYAPDRSNLLAQRNVSQAATVRESNTTTSTDTGTGSAFDITALGEAIAAAMQSAPIQVQSTLKLDGRTVSQSVQENARSQRVRSYQ